MTSSSASVSLTPSPEHRFSFGLWTIRPPPLTTLSERRRAPPSTRQIS